MSTMWKILAGLAACLAFVAAVVFLRRPSQGGALATALRVAQTTAEVKSLQAKRETLRAKDQESGERVAKLDAQAKDIRKRREALRQAQGRTAEEVDRDLKSLGF